MTKKDYELIASSFDINWLNSHYPHNDSERTARRKRFDACLDTTIQTARRMASKLQQDNPLFDKVKFLRACGVSDNQLMYYSEIEKTSNYDMWSKV